MRKLVLAFSTVALACAGCSNSVGGTQDAAAEASPDGGGTTGCTGDLDCPSASDRCFFAIDGGCSQTGPVGTCMPYTPPASCTPTVACGCDGTTISECAPDGYVDRLSAGPGACPPAADAGADASDAAATDAASE